MIQLGICYAVRACQLLLLNFLLNDQAENASVFSKIIIVDFSPVKLKLHVCDSLLLSIVTFWKHYFKSRIL